MSFGNYIVVYSFGGISAEALLFSWVCGILFKDLLLFKRFASCVSSVEQ